MPHLGRKNWVHKVNQQNAGENNHQGVAAVKIANAILGWTNV